jgi:hypothetical protein
MKSQPRTDDLVVAQQALPEVVQHRLADGRLLVFVADRPDLRVHSLKDLRVS